MPHKSERTNAEAAQGRSQDCQHIKGGGDYQGDILMTTRPGKNHTVRAAALCPQDPLSLTTFQLLQCLSPAIIPLTTKAQAFA